jgi:hypothetical protein
MGHRVVDLTALPALLSGGIITVLGFKVATTSLPSGLFMLAIGGLTFVLGVRMLSNRGAAKRLESTGELTGPHFDYLIWSALGVPMLMVLALAILAITGALNTR